MREWVGERDEQVDEWMGGHWWYNLIPRLLLLEWVVWE